MDSVSAFVSKDVRFTMGEDLDQDRMPGTTILGIDDDGFHHVQIDLKVLSTPKPSNTTGAANTSEVQSTCNSNARFDTIVMMDIGNMGFHLVLDDIKLIPADIFTASSSDITRPTVVPVLNDDLNSLKSGFNR